MSRRKCVPSEWIFSFPCPIWSSAANVGVAQTDSQLLRDGAEHRSEPAFAVAAGILARREPGFQPGGKNLTQIRAA